MNQPMKIAVIGCGDISKAYAPGTKSAGNLEVVACGDRNHDAAVAKAEAYGCEARSIDAILNDPAIELILNLTIPQAHVPVGLQAVEKGKHVYMEKPLALDVDEGRKLVDAADKAGLRVGCAPDTFLGSGIQTAGKLIDDGLMGSIVGGLCAMIVGGHESWHPAPEFYYQPGGGPMLDMGPYYITALVSMLGPVKRVSGFTKASFSERTCTSEARKGDVIPVDTTTHQAGTLEFHNGAIVTLITSFDVKHGADCKPIQIWGTRGSMFVPDPNTFGERERVHFKGATESEWLDVPRAFPDNARTFGLVDMVQAIRDGRPHRANGHLALHVLEVMTAFERSSASDSHVTIDNTCARPLPLPSGLAEWSIA
jgi:predicted dehydrogenase